MIKPFGGGGAKQVAPGDTTAVEVLAGVAEGPYLEIVGIVVANSDSSASTFRIFHDLDADGSPTYNSGNALWYDKSVAANDTFEWWATAPGLGIPLGKEGSLGFRSGKADVVTCTVYYMSGHVREQSADAR